MKSRITLFVLLLCVCQFTSAQSQDSTYLRHSLGIITSPVLNNIFSSNRELPVGIIYKYQLTPNSAIRTTILGSFNNYKFTSKFGSPDNYNKNYTLYSQFSIGYERHIPLKSSWMVYYGAETGPLMLREVKKELSFRPSDVGDTQYTLDVVDETRGLFLRPFLGITFRVSSRFFLATETAIVARHQRREFNSVIATRHLSSGETLSGYRENGIWHENSLKYQPISNVSLLLRF